MDFDSKLTPEALQALRKSWARISRAFNALETERERSEQGLRDQIELLRRALHEVGITDSGPEWEGLLRRTVEGIVSSEKLKVHDPKSREIVEAVLREAEKLFLLLRQANEYSGISDEAVPKLPDSPYTNVCAELFRFLPADYALSVVSGISGNARRALRSGRPITGRGRPAKLPYYAYVRELHSLYSKATGRKGYYEKDGTAYGPLVELVKSAQGLLPEHMRLRVDSTIGSRVITALKRNNQQ